MPPQSPLGDRADNIEQAIEHCEQALKVYTQKDFPADWAMTQNNLATPTTTAYGATGPITSSRPSSTTAGPEGLHQKDFPAEWAATQNNLANAYRQPHPGRPGR